MLFAGGPTRSLMCAWHWRRCGSGGWAAGTGRVFWGGRLGHMLATAGTVAVALPWWLGAFPWALADQLERVNLRVECNKGSSTVQAKPPASSTTAVICSVWRAAQAFPVRASLPCQVAPRDLKQAHHPSYAHLRKLAAQILN